MVQEINPHKPENVLVMSCFHYSSLACSNVVALWLSNIDKNVANFISGKATTPFIMYIIKKDMSLFEMLQNVKFGSGLELGFEYVRVRFT